MDTQTSRYRFNDRNRMNTCIGKTLENQLLDDFLYIIFIYFSLLHHWEQRIKLQGRHANSFMEDLAWNTQYRHGNTGIEYKHGNKFTEELALKEWQGNTGIEILAWKYWHGNTGIEILPWKYWH